MPTAIRVERRTVLQDLLRRYTVLIDDQPVGRMPALAKREYAVTPGTHSLQLVIAGTGRSKSDRIVVEVPEGQTRTVRTVGLGVKLFLQIPLGIFFPDRFAPRPWIRLAERSNG